MISVIDLKNIPKNEGEVGSLPLISIITVVYNAVNTIEQTIQSVIQQSYQNKEYIIIDGGSTDGTVDLIKRYESHLSYWVSEPDLGIYDAMNKGISMAKGELVGIINADDWYEGDIFSIIADKFRETGSDHVIYGLLRIFQNDKFYSLVGNSINVLPDEPIMHPTCFVPRQIYQTYGKYDLKYKYSADYDLFLRFANHGVKFCFIEKTIANFRRGGISFSPSAEKEKFKVKRRHHLISKTEYFSRIFLIQLVFFIKKCRVR
jgi:glycosyltransferase involved in cell wall biosynthesis